MRMRLPKLQDNDKKAKKLRLEGLLKGWKDIEEVLYYQGHLYVPKVICSELINKYHNNLLVGHFSIKKTLELITKKYYWLTLKRDIKAYIKGCDICLASKAVGHKLYRDLQSLFIPIHW